MTSEQEYATRARWVEKRFMVCRSAPKARHSCSPCAAEQWESVIRLDREPGGRHSGGAQGCIPCAPTFFTNQACRPAGSIFFDLTTPWLVRTRATRMTRLRHPPNEDRVRRSPGFGAAQQLSSCWDPLKSMALTQTETTRRFDSLLHFRVSKLCGQPYSLDCC